MHNNIPIRVKFIPLSSTAKAPLYASAGAAGADLFADIETWVKPGKHRLVETNIAIELPFGYEAQVRSRSGLALKKGIFVLNSPGTIDSDYRGGIGVILFNTGEDDFWIKPGDRIAQLVIAAVPRAEFVQTGVIDATQRGAGGFGSTGVGETRKEMVSRYKGPY